MRTLTVVAGHPGTVDCRPAHIARISAVVGEFTRARRLASALRYEWPSMPPTELSRAPLAVPALLELPAPPAVPQSRDGAAPAQALVDEDVDQASSAQLTESWSELLPDFFVLPAAVEAAKASADEGPGPWPPVIADDPVDAPPAAPAASSDVPGASARRPTTSSLSRLLRQLKTRRRRAVSEYP